MSSRTRMQWIIPISGDFICLAVTSLRANIEIMADKVVLFSAWSQNMTSIRLREDGGLGVDVSVLLYRFEQWELSGAEKNLISRPD